jgi:hypothetical protein
MRVAYVVIGIFCGLISLLGLGAFFGGLALVGLAIWIQEKLDERQSKSPDGMYPLP